MAAKAAGVNYDDLVLWLLLQTLKTNPVAGARK
jgi:hypothetical protein